MKRSLYIVIVGCGRLGSSLANRMSSRGHSVVVIDRDERTFSGLTAEFSGFHLQGDATHLSVLNQARLEKADLFIASTHDDNVNLMVAQVARRLFSIPRVLARVYDPRREQVYLQLGIETVCPTTAAVQALLGVLQETEVAKGERNI